MPAEQTNLTTKDGLTVYDLDTLSGELWAVAGPAGVEPESIDPNELPDRFRWITCEEWETL